MYQELLKDEYYKERKKLEAMPVFKQESKLRFVRMKIDIAERLENRLSVGEIMGRADIHEELKDSIIRAHEDAFKNRLNDNIENDREEADKEEKEELGYANYSAQDFADYLFQLEKVYALEEALTEEKMFSEQVYYEMAEKEKKNIST